MMFKKVNENPLLANMDLNNVKTKLQKETEAIVAEQKAKDAAARGEAPPKNGAANRRGGFRKVR
jgi:hypothetical protein